MLFFSFSFSFCGLVLFVWKWTPRKTKRKESYWRRFKTSGNKKKKNEPSLFLWFWESLHQFNVHCAVLIKKKPVSDGREERKASHTSCAEARRKAKRYWESDPYPAPIECWEQRQKRSQWETKQMYVHREICKGKEILTHRSSFFFFFFFTVISSCYDIWQS